MKSLRTIYKHYQELAIPIILSGGIGLSVIFISIADGFNADLYGYLFGSVSAVSRSDLYLIIGVGIAVIITLIYVL